MSLPAEAERNVICYTPEQSFFEKLRKAVTKRGVQPTSIQTVIEGSNHSLPIIIVEDHLKKSDILQNYSCRISYGRCGDGLTQIDVYVIQGQNTRHYSCSCKGNGGYAHQFSLTVSQKGGINGSINISYLSEDTILTNELNKLLDLCNDNQGPIEFADPETIFKIEKDSR